MSLDLQSLFASPSAQLICPGFHAQINAKTSHLMVIVMSGDWQMSQGRQPDKRGCEEDEGQAQFFSSRKKGASSVYI